MCVAFLLKFYHNLARDETSDKFDRRNGDDAQSSRVLQNWNALWWWVAVDVGAASIGSMAKVSMTIYRILAYARSWLASCSLDMLSVERCNAIIPFDWEKKNGPRRGRRVRGEDHSINNTPTQLLHTHTHTHTPTKTLTHTLRSTYTPASIS